MQNDILYSHSFVCNKQDNGGESLVLKTDFIDNGDLDHGIPRDFNNGFGMFWNQTLTLNSYGNSASLKLFGAILTPNLLRELANQLDRAFVDAKLSTVYKENN